MTNKIPQFQLPRFEKKEEAILKYYSAKQENLDKSEHLF